MVCMGNASFQPCLGRDGKVSRDVSEVVGNQTSAGAFRVAWFVFEAVR